jgi:hypothetical protein
MIETLSITMIETLSTLLLTPAADGNQQTFLNSVKKAVKKAKNAPLNLTLERISVFCSFVCLVCEFWVLRRVRNLTISE